ncbi:MAG: DUF2721 domain-containing protein [Verrucomicrobia bacterium]|nr:MAG: DUF2721 domain-containing protein [Verrucomicrobiota bacterium]
MENFNIESLSKLMQLSISPTVLISAVGLLLLSVTNRLGRAIDRSRSIVKELDLEELVAREDSTAQLNILIRRASLLRLSVCLLVMSIFFSCLMILFLFLKGFWEMQIDMVVIGIFSMNMAVLLGAMGYLLADIFLSLRALKIEVSRHLKLVDQAKIR